VPPDWLDALPDRPTALASLGTVFNRTPDVLEAIVDALADEPVNLIVAIGRDEDPERFGAHPDNVRLEPYVPQPLVLERSGAFVTHGGFNSVKEALSAGVPMVVVPITADQRYSAERCAALGVGRWIRPDERGPEAIRDAAREVLAEPSYRARASEFQAEMNALPGPRSGSSCSRRWRGPARRRFSRAHAACAGATPPPAGPRQPACPR
jgi:MGT family glycosyltransferase